MWWQIFLVLGVLLNACAVWGAPAPWFPRAGWLFYALAAILWLAAPESGPPLHGHHLTFD